MSEEMGASVPRRQLGRLLKQAREKAGISIDGAARELEFSRNKIYRIEGGQAPLRKVDVLAMVDLYQIPPDMAMVLVALASQTKAKGWWHSFGDILPAWFELYVSLEAAASELREYQPVIVPGVLQTEAYATALCRAHPDHTDDDVKRLVGLRMERQRLLARRAPRPPTLDVIVDESVLRRPIAQPAAMSDQLMRLAAASDTKHVHVRVLPLTVGPHRASQSGAFAILDFRAEKGRQPEPTTVYSEGLTGAVYLNKPAEVEIYEDAWNCLDDFALDVDQSRALMKTVAKEYDDA